MFDFYPLSCVIILLLVMKFLVTGLFMYFMLISSVLQMCVEMYSTLLLCFTKIMFAENVIDLLV